jgi:quercetin dioxygenase-like cupin family protein
MMLDRWSLLAWLLVLACLVAGQAAAQDTLKANPANATLKFENSRVRALEIVIKPGERDNEHSHPDYATYVVSGGKFRVHTKDGDSVGEFKTGDVILRPAQTHWAENIGKTTIHLILFEWKDLKLPGDALAIPPDKDTLKANADTVKFKAENDKIRALESALKPGTREHEHSHPNYITYVISGGSVRNHSNGTESPGEMKTGDVMYRDARTHWSENVGDTTVRVIMFEIKGLKE